MRIAPALLLLAILVTSLVGCASRRPDRRPWLQDAYGPSSSPALSLPELPRATIENDNGQHRIAVEGPNGQVYAVRWDSVSESVGEPNAGSLRDGAPLPGTGPGFRHVGKNPFGTDETVTFLQLAAYVVNQADPARPPVLIGDISRDGGGWLSPHKSHRTGRDADVGLYGLDAKPRRRFERLSPRELDADATWAFIETLLRTGSLKYVFVDRGLHDVLYEAGERRGFSGTSLDRLFEGHSDDRRSVIRHVAGHADHLHVRFRCPSTDYDCVD